MRDPARILVVDDVPDNVEILRMRLSALGYDVDEANDGEQALAKVAADPPDLVLLDIMMPKIDGLEVVRRMKADKSLPFIPVILVTAKATPKDVVAGLDAGGDDYLTKPIDHGALVARVRAMLRIKALHDEVQALNQGLESKVREQVDELERVGRLRRFLAPQLAQAIVSAGDEKILENHRREVVAMFCDLRGFTGFSETAEPEDIMQVLTEYHGAVGPLIRKYEGTLDRFTGDGMMVFFNDPLPCPDAPDRAAKLALEMRDAVSALLPVWAKRGHKLGFGIGKATPPWAASASKIASTTPPSAPSSISPPGSAPTRPTARSWPAADLPPPSRTPSYWKISANASCAAWPAPWPCEISPP